MNGIIDLLDAAAKKYPIKALADEIDKAESTLRNELTQQPGYKLGLKTAIRIMRITGDLSALDVIEASFKRVAFEIPAARIGDPMPLMKHVANLSKEFGEAIQEVSYALKDGKLEGHEVKKCLKELKDLIAAGLKMKTYLEELEKKLCVQ